MQEVCAFACTNFETVKNAGFAGILDCRGGRWLAIASKARSKFEHLLIPLSGRRNCTPNLLEPDWRELT
jgi:hypothetical protein